MSTENDERYTPEEESYDPEGIAELRRQEEEERLNRRIRREIIRIESGESDEAIEQERQRMEEEEEDVLLNEFSDEIDQWIIDALIAIGCDTAKSVLALSVADIMKRADLEEETVVDVQRILKAEFEDNV